MWGPPGGPSPPGPTREVPGPCPGTSKVCGSLRAAPAPVPAWPTLRAWLGAVPGCGRLSVGRPCLSGALPPVAAVPAAPQVPRCGAGVSRPGQLAPPWLAPPAAWSPAVPSAVCGCPCVGGAALPGSVPVRGPARSPLGPPSRSPCPGPLLRLWRAGSWAGAAAALRPCRRSSPSGGGWGGHRPPWNQPPPPSMGFGSVVCLGDSGSPTSGATVRAGGCGRRWKR